jgi:hypothetical protein
MPLQENRRLQEPLNQALKQVEQLRQQLANYEKDKLSLAQTKARLLNAEKQLKNLEWENEVGRACDVARREHRLHACMRRCVRPCPEVPPSPVACTVQCAQRTFARASLRFAAVRLPLQVLSQRFSKVQSERDDLYEKFEASIYDVQQKTGLKSALLERRLEAMQEALEMKEAQLAEVRAGWCVASAAYRCHLQAGACMTANGLGMCDVAVCRCLCTPAHLWRRCCPSPLGSRLHKHTHARTRTRAHTHTHTHTHTMAPHS